MVGAYRWTRRCLVFAGLSMPLARFATAALSPPNELILSNRRGIVIRPSPEHLDAPLLSVFLPGMEDAPCAVVEMPEHSWGRPRGTTEQRWFYRMYPETRDAVRPAARWERRDNTLICSMTSPAGVRLHSAVSLDDDGISIEHRLENTADVDYEEVQAPSCIKLYRPFNDVFLERTYVHHSDGLALLANETPERLHMNAEEWLPVRYIVRCAPPAAPPEMRMQRQPGGIVRYNKLKLADAPFIATTSSPAGWVAASHTFKASSVFTNPARTCHHVDPSAEMKPRGTALLSLKLYLLRGSAEDAWRLVAKNRERGRM
jgi:hypothetical protein